ncbi:M1 family metallopeptidase [uncultured Croceitalea sp.]|uniref:M1 family metallopeptidase n=1 Tax=uncultured Croceitalea sp. TaxID=1798908 RepID=UPI0033056BD7
MRNPLFSFLLCFGCQLCGQEPPSVDFTHIKVEISLHPQTKEISGQGEYTFEVLRRTDSIFIDAVDMQFETVNLNGKKLKYTNDGMRLGFKAPKKNGNYLLGLFYRAEPRQTLYFLGWNIPDSIRNHSEKGDMFTKIKKTMDYKLFDAIDYGKREIWTQGQGKYTSHWLPSFDNMNEKVEFDLEIISDKSFQTIANGSLINVEKHGQTKKWSFNMTKPMSSYLVAFVVGDFDKKELRSSSGVPIELYYRPADSLRVEPTYRYTQQIFDFLENEIGVAYPWQNYKQVPVQDFLYAGMENTSCTIFSNSYMIDSIGFVDKNYVNVNAHELAHQWFGNMVTEVSGAHHWLHEGFATYYAYLAEKELFGEHHFYWKLYDTARTLHDASESGNGEALVNPKASSLTFYEKGAWALVMLRELLGDVAFQKGIQSYLKTYAYKNATIPNFLVEMERASGKDLSGFQSEWLTQKAFPWVIAKSYLEKKNASLQQFFEAQKSIADTTVVEEDKLALFWNNKTPVPLKKQFLFDYGRQISDSNIQKIIQRETIEVRQAVAMVLPKIPKTLQDDFESMLMDKSYLTQEIVLYKLWEAFPEHRFEYLDQLDNTIGLPNKNVRLLWLTLALVTEDYNNDLKQQYYQELNDYTSPASHFEVRQSAFQYLSQIQAMDEKSLLNLIKATNHHVWQFKKSSRNLVREFAKTEANKKRLMSLLDTLADEQRQTIEKLLNP